MATIGSVGVLQNPGKITSVGVAQNVGKIVSVGVAQNVGKIVAVGTLDKFQNVGRIVSVGVSPAQAQAEAAARVQAAAAEAQRRAAAEAERIRVELARIKEENRKRVQGELDSKVAANKLTLGKIAPGKLSLGTVNPGKIKSVGVAQNVGTLKIKELSAYEKAKLDAYYKALADIEKKKQSNKTGLSKLLDKVTFGQERRDAEAREQAKKELERISKETLSNFESNVNKFLAEQAKRKSGIESAKFDSQASFDAAVKQYDAWQKAGIGGLQGQMAQLEGSSEAFDKASKAPSTTKIARLLTNARDFATTNSIAKNAFQVLSYPARVVNTIGNLNTQDRTIYKSGGASEVRKPGIVNAWNASENQRSFNIKPFTDVAYNKKSAEQKFGDLATSYINSQKAIGNNPPSRDRVLQSMWNTDNERHRKYNSTLEFLADPALPLSGTVKAVKSLGYANKLLDTVKSTKIGSAVTNFFSNGKVGEATQWLNTEHKSATEKIQDLLSSAKEAQTKIQDRYFPRINALDSKIYGKNAMPDVSVLNEIAKLTDHEAAILQRTKNGKFSPFDSLRLAGSGSKPIREKLLALAAKTTDWTEQMKLVDNVNRTRYGAGKRFYAPRTNWVAQNGRSLEDYNFHIRKKRYPTQSAADLHRSFIDRYFKSNVDDLHIANETQKKQRRIAERNQLVSMYDAELQPHKQAIAELQSKHKTRLKLGKYNPMNIWRKSVLQFRPAWYVNNIGYNTQASVLAGGSRALVEQAKLLRPKNYRNAMAEVPKELQTNLAKEAGTGRLAKLGNRVENVARIGAYKSLIRKGSMPDEAIKRVDKYLFDYKIKNWERPFKAVMPFWSFQKNLFKAAANMPTDRPLAAAGYNRLDDYQNHQYDEDFKKTIPGLKEAGYSDDEIAKIKEENRKYFDGKLKLGGRYYNTPFNAFSEKGLSNMSVNPFFEAVAEVVSAKDHFGRELAGNDGSIISRLLSKFPQADLLKQAKSKLWDNPRYKPSTQWIGAPGSEGYGMGKEAQGYGPSKPNYQKSLDKGANLMPNVGAFLGLPKSIPFDGDTLVRGKTMQKLKDEYFAHDWNAEFPNFQDRTVAQKKLFDRYGISQDEFYKGELAKYDDANTIAIKTMKEDARKKSSALFAEYGKQPVGTRGVWATQKLKSLVDSGYFDENPFLSSFDWLQPKQIQSAQKTIAYRNAKASGDWSAYQKAYGDGRKHSPYSYNGKFFKTAESRDRYIAGLNKKPAADFWKRYAMSDAETRRQLIKDNPQYSKYPTGTKPKTASALFWEQYVASDRQTRRDLIAKNPQFNTRADWTPEQWDASRLLQSAKLKTSARSLVGFEDREKANKLINEILASRVTNKAKKAPKIKVLLS